MEGTLQFAQVGETTAIYPASRLARSYSRLDGSLTTRMSGKVWLLTCISPKSSMGRYECCVEITYRALCSELPARLWILGICALWLTLLQDGLLQHQPRSAGQMPE
jgi:hypothetical protein